LLEINLKNYYKEITYSFRIEQSMVTNMLSDNNRVSQTIICKIINAITIHRQAMELVRNFNSYVIITTSSNILFIKGYISF